MKGTRLVHLIFNSDYEEKKNFLTNGFTINAFIKSVAIPVNSGIYIKKIK